MARWLLCSEKEVQSCHDTPKALSGSMTGAFTILPHFSSFLDLIFIAPYEYVVC